MLKKAKKSDPSYSTNVDDSKANGSSPSTIGLGSHITGDFKSSSDIRVDGSLKGNMICSGKLIIGPKAFIEGRIECSNAIVEGKFVGELYVKQSLEVRASAQLNGQINTNRLEVHSGAQFNVQCNTGGKSIKSFTREVDEKGEVVSLVK